MGHPVLYQWPCRDQILSWVPDRHGQESARGGLFKNTKFLKYHRSSKYIYFAESCGCAEPRCYWELLSVSKCTWAFFVQWHWYPTGRNVPPPTYSPHAHIFYSHVLPLLLRTSVCATCACGIFDYYGRPFLEAIKRTRPRLFLFDQNTSWTRVNILPSLYFIPTFSVFIPIFIQIAVFYPI